VTKPGLGTRRSNRNTAIPPKAGIQFDVQLPGGTEMKTSVYSILCIAIRLATVLWAIGSISNLPFSWIAALSTPNPSATLTWLLSGVAVQLLVVAMLWLYPGMLAGFVAGRSSHEVFESSISQIQLQYTALSVLGAWFVVQGCVFLSYELVRTIQFAFENLPMKLATLAEAGIRVVGGIVLMLGSRGLVGALNSFRNGANALPAIASNGDESA
jgi:hypothetical protein